MTENLVKAVGELNLKCEGSEEFCKLKKKSGAKSQQTDPDFSQKGEKNQSRGSVTMGSFQKDRY